MRKYRITDEAVINGETTTGMMVELCADFTANHQGPWEDWREMGIGLSQILLPAEARERLIKYFQHNPRERRTPQEDFPQWLRVFYSPYRNIFVISFDGSAFAGDRSFNAERWNQFIQILREDPQAAAAQAGDHEKNNIERSVIARDLVKAIAEASLSYRNQWEFFKPTLKLVVYGAIGMIFLVGVLVPLLQASLDPKKPKNPQALIGYLVLLFCVVPVVSALYFLLRKFLASVILTGHGLGGHIAEDVALDLKKYNAMTFESPGVSLPGSSGRASMESFICDATRLGSMPKHAGKYIYIGTPSTRGPQALPTVQNRVRFLGGTRILADVILDASPSPGVNRSLDEVANLVSQSGEDAGTTRRPRRR